MTDDRRVAQAHDRAADFLERGGRVLGEGGGFDAADLDVLLARVREVHGLVAVNFLDPDRKI